MIFFNKIVKNITNKSQDRNIGKIEIFMLLF